MRDKKILMIMLGSSFSPLLDIRLSIFPLLVIVFLALYAFRQKVEKVKYRNRVRVESNKFLFYLILSLRVSPNFEEAIRFAFENSDRSLQREISPFLFKATLGLTSYEKALQEFAKKWNLETFARVLPTIGSSVEMRFPEREQTLNEVTQQLLEQEREEFFSFCSWLHSPLLILYSVCILLPIALLPALPVLSAFGFNLGTWGLLGFLVAALLLTYFASQYLLAQSLFFHKFAPSRPPVSHILLSLIGILPFPWLTGELKIWIPLWISVLIFSFLLWDSSRRGAQERKKSLQMEEELPMVLKQVGGNLIKGQSAEEALRKVRGGELSEILQKGSLNVMLGNLNLYSSLFDSREGVLRQIRSNEIKEALKLALSIAKKSSDESGRTLIKLSEHLANLQRVRREGQHLLSNIVSSMRSLSLFFGPAILAITARMLLLLQMKGTLLLSLSFDPSLLLLLLGIYCLGVCWILLTLCHRIGGGDEETERYLLAQALPLSLAVFTIFSLFGYQLVQNLVR